MQILEYPFPYSLVSFQQPVGLSEEEKRALCWLIEKHPGEILEVSEKANTPPLFPNRTVHHRTTLGTDQQRWSNIRVVFIDVAPTYTNVKEATEKAFHFLKISGGGLIIWHDYYLLSPSPLCARVTDYLHEQIAPNFPDLTAISMTRLAYLFI